MFFPHFVLVQQWKAQGIRNPGIERRETEQGEAMHLREMSTAWVCVNQKVCIGTLLQEGGTPLPLG